MTRRILALAACLAAACGGGGGDHVNPATAKNFTYGAGATAPAPAGTADALSSALEFQGAPSSSTAQGAPGSLLEAADAAIGSDGLFFFSGKVSALAPAVEKARAAALSTPLGGDATFPSGCTTVAGGTATFKDCTYRLTTPDGETTVTVNGTATAVPGQVRWDLTVSVGMVSAGFTIGGTFVDEGDFAITPTTVIATEAAELHVTASGGGQSASVGLAQAARLDVGYADAATCSTRITSGTFEAKRVWMERPRDATGLDFTDRAAKFTWGGCGTGTLQYSVN
jgi:hypothetical protein